MIAVFLFLEITVYLNKVKVFKCADLLRVHWVYLSSKSQYLFVCDTLKLYSIITLLSLSIVNKEKSFEVDTKLTKLVCCMIS